ncbi:MAG: SH3 domain-containing protein [Candidatus Omnitrophota bacterium]
MKPAFWILLVLASLTISSSASADTLMLSNGDQAVGTILSENAEKVVIDIRGMPVEIPSSYILYIVQNGVQRKVGEKPAGIGGTILSATETAIPSNIQSVTSTTTIPPGPVDSNPAPLLPVVLPRGKAYQVTSTGISFRKGPSLEYPVISMLSGQTILIEIEFSREWLHASTLEGTEGWIHQNFIRPMENTPCLAAADQLNIREAPGEVYRSLARLQRGAVVVKMEERDEWYNVLYREDEKHCVAGWCNKQYLIPLLQPNLYRPPMKLAKNSAVGMPILLQKTPLAGGLAKLSLTARDPMLTRNGIAKVIVFHKDRSLLDRDGTLYSSEAILLRERLVNSGDILNIGLPEELSLRYVGGDILTMLGERTMDAWQYSLTLPDVPTLAFALTVQEGPARGTIIEVE